MAPFSSKVTGNALSFQASMDSVRGPKQALGGGSRNIGNSKFLLCCFSHHAIEIIN